jgi:hypothetical protein
MATTSTENNVIGEKQESDAATRSGNNDKERDLDSGSVRRDRERSVTADAHKGAESDDVKSFLRYEERHW